MATTTLQPLTADYRRANSINTHNPSLHLNNYLLTSSNSSHFLRTTKQQAAARLSVSPKASLNRRHLIADTAAIVSLSPFLGFHLPVAKAEESLSEWEKISLPIDPGVVLLDIAFVPDDPSHGVISTLVFEF